MSHEALIAIRPICITTYAVGPPPAEPATALAKQGRTTGEVLEVGVAPIPTVPGASPARETATILSSELDSPLTTRVWCLAPAGCPNTGRIQVC